MDRFSKERRRKRLTRTLSKIQRCLAWTKKTGKIILLNRQKFSGTFIFLFSIQQYVSLSLFLVSQWNSIDFIFSISFLQLILFVLTNIFLKTFFIISQMEFCFGITADKKYSPETRAFWFRFKSFHNNGSCKFKKSLI